MKFLNTALGLGLALASASFIGCNSGLTESSAQESSLRQQGAVVESPAGAIDHGNTGKVSVCHIPPGNPANMHTINVGSPAVEAHLAHGDALGECIEPPPEDDGVVPPVDTEEPPTETGSDQS